MDSAYSDTKGLRVCLIVLFGADRAYSTLSTFPEQECSYFHLNTDFTFEIRIYKEWDESLRHKTSDAFKKFSTLIKKEVGLWVTLDINVQLGWLSSDPRGRFSIFTLISLNRPCIPASAVFIYASLLYATKFYMSHTKYTFLAELQRPERPLERNPVLI